jgi:hypothetical protein
VRFGAPASDAQPETVTRQRGGGGGSAVARRTATPRWCRNAAPHDEAYERTSASAVRPRRARARSYGVTGRVTDPAFPAEGASGGLGERGKHRAHGSKRTAPGGSASAARRRRRRLATAPLSRRRQATPRRGAPRGPSRVERLAARRRRDTLGVGATLASARPPPETGARVGAGWPETRRSRRDRAQGPRLRAPRRAGTGGHDLRVGSGGSAPPGVGARRSLRLPGRSGRRVFAPRRLRPATLGCGFEIADGNGPSLARDRGEAGRYAGSVEVKGATASPPPWLATEVTGSRPGGDSPGASARSRAGRVPPRWQRQRDGPARGTGARAWFATRVPARGRDPCARLRACTARASGPCGSGRDGAPRRDEVGGRLRVDRKSGVRLRRPDRRAADAPPGRALRLGGAGPPGPTQGAPLRGCERRLLPATPTRRLPRTAWTIRRDGSYVRQRWRVRQVGFFGSPADGGPPGPPRRAARSASVRPRTRRRATGRARGRAGRTHAHGMPDAPRSVPAGRSRSTGSYGGAQRQGGNGHGDMVRLSAS